MRYTIWFILTFMWLGGVAIAQGFWMTTFTLFPIYGIYVFIERVLSMVGML